MEDQSTTNNILTPYSTQNGLVGWVDILGVRGMGVEKRNTLYDSLADFLPNFSTNYVQAEGKQIPINETNALIVGDALCITQSSDSSGSALFVVHTTLVLSQYLFAGGFSHRGYITRGSYRANHPENGLPFITGEAIIDAVNKEENMKTVGIAADPNMIPTIRGLRGQIGNVMWTKNPIFEKYHLISSNLHMSRWKLFCEQYFTEHPYISAAKSIISQNDLWDS